MLSNEGVLLSVILGERLEGGLNFERARHLRVVSKEGHEACYDTRHHEEEGRGEREKSGGHTIALKTSLR